MWLLGVSDLKKVMEAAGNKRKAKNKQWFKGQKKRKFSLCPDIKGFLCFCNYREKEAIREAYNILNQHYEEVENTAAAVREDEEEDIDAQLEKEKSELAKEAGESEEGRRFQVVESGVNNVLFIRTQVPDPLALVTKVLEGIRDSRKQVTRHLIRMLPVQATCKAYEQNVRPAVQTLVDEFVAARKSETTKYQVLFKARMNQNLFKEDALKVVQDIVKDKGFKPDLKSPDVCFVFEVLKSNCCISILPNYFELKKYNLIELAQAAKPTEKLAEPAEATEEAATVAAESRATDVAAPTEATEVRAPTLLSPDQDPAEPPATSEESSSKNEET